MQKNTMVFIFPQIDAGITFPPFSTAINLYPDTINSLINIIMGIQDGIFEYSTKQAIMENSASIYMNNLQFGINILSTSLLVICVIATIFLGLKIFQKL